MRLLGVICLSLFALVGCSAQTLISQAYPDREIISFRTSDGADVNTYACVKGPSAEATKARAAKAHRYFDKRLNALAGNYAS